MGGFGKRLFEPMGLFGEFPIAAHKAEQHRKQAVGGALFFGYLLLSKQKKETRLVAKKYVSYGVLQASTPYDCLPPKIDLSLNAFLQLLFCAPAINGASKFLVTE